MFLDTETTGLDSWAQAVELAIVDHMGTILYDTRICPTVAVSSEAERIHGLGMDVLEGAPTFADVWPEIADVLDGRTLAIYNEEFDFRIMRQSFDAWRLPGYLWRFAERPWCVMRLYAAFWGESRYTGSWKWQTLSAACLQQRLQVPAGLRLHSALADAEMTRRLTYVMAGYPVPSGDWQDPDRGGERRDLSE